MVIFNHFHKTKGKPFVLYFFCKWSLSLWYLKSGREKYPWLENLILFSSSLVSVGAPKPWRIKSERYHTSRNFAEHLLKSHFSNIQEKKTKICNSHGNGGCRRKGTMVYCKFQTPSGSCDNCGSPCSDSPGKCCYSTEIPPTKRPTNVEVVPDSCEWRQQRYEWVCKYGSTVQHTVNYYWLFLGTFWVWLNQILLLILHSNHNTKSILLIFRRHLCVPIKHGEAVVEQETNTVVTCQRSVVRVTTVELDALMPLLTLSFHAVQDALYHQHLHQSQNLLQKTFVSHLQPKLILKMENQWQCPNWQ